MRINMLQQLATMQADKILRVNVDGIYYIEHDFELKHTFRDGFKDGKIHVPQNKASSCYFVSDATEYKNKFEKILNIPYVPGARIELGYGSGGTGKSEYYLKNRPDLVDSQFTTICKRLLTEKNNEYGCKTITIAKLLSGAWQKYLKVYPSNILVDECTMMTNLQKEKLITDFPYSHIIFMGDIDAQNIIYQIPCIEGQRFNIDKIEYMKEFTTNYRCKCDILRKLLMDVRNLIKLVHVSNDKDNVDIAFGKLKEQFIKLNMIRSIDETKTMYTLNDYIITPLNKYADFWTNEFKGKFEQEKYYVTKNNQFHDNGNIIIADKDKKPVSSIIKHAYTIHSIQGVTARTQLFIDMRNMFGGLEMLYTALSRAQYLNNIYIIY